MMAHLLNQMVEHDVGLDAQKRKAKTCPLTVSTKWLRMCDGKRRRGRFKMVCVIPWIGVE
jgi:hypothetical protein